jgi:hypothetical protein
VCERCSYDNACVNHQQTAHKQCLDQQYKIIAQRNELIEDEKAAQRYLTKNCDISKITYVHSEL